MVTYLTGVSRESVWSIAKSVGLGLMVQPGNGQFNRIAEYPAWAADNGCFRQEPRFSLSGYLSWLDKLRKDQPTCLFATAPDVMQDARATWERTRPVLPQIRALGYPAALVAQDGWTGEVDWDAFDVLFIGGSTPFKLGAGAVVREAKRRGKWVHLGRVNSLRRLVAAQLMGADSTDGTFLKYGPDVNLPRLLRWLEALRVQPTLPLEGE